MCQPGYSGDDCDNFNENTCSVADVDCGYGGTCVNNNVLLYAEYEEPPYWVAGACLIVLYRYAVSASRGGLLIVNITTATYN